MDFDDSPDEAAHRAGVRDLLEQHADDLLRLRPGQEGVDARTSEAEMWRTQRVLADAGLVGVPWPKEFGGQGGTLMHAPGPTSAAGRAPSGTAPPDDVAPPGGRDPDREEDDGDRRAEPPCQ